MNSRTLLERLVGPAALALVLLVSNEGHASPSFPQEIQNYAGMACPPTCTLCHRTQEGGAGTTRGAFAVSMVTIGRIEAGKPEGVYPALAAAQGFTPQPDGDGDGTGDVSELRAMRDPLVNGIQVSDAIICPPTYGCGARIAPRPPLDGSALAFALAVAGYLVVRLRRRA